MIRKFISLAILALMLHVAIGCQNYENRYTRTLDATFVYTTAVPMTIDDWESSMDRLLILVSIGDEDAIDFAWHAMPSVCRIDVVYHERRLLLEKLYNNCYKSDSPLGEDYMSGMESLSPADQAVFIRAYDQLKPTDWNTVKVNVIARHPDVAALLSAGS